MYSERLFAKKCSVELPEQEYDEGIGISVWLNKLSRCKFKRGAANPFWVSWKAVEACGMVWCCILFCGMVNGNGLCWTLRVDMAWHCVGGMVKQGMVWLHGVLKPVSRWGQCPPAGILWREICTGLPSPFARRWVLHRAVHAAPYCSLSRRHSPGWSHHCF